MEKEQTIASMQKQIEELKRRAEQGSQQLQGEVQELNWSRCCAPSFPSTPSSRCQRANMAATSSSESSAHAAQSAAQSSGSPNGPRTGATAGWPSCAKTSAPPRPRSPCWSARCCPRTWRLSISWTACGSRTPRAALPVALALRQMLYRSRRWPASQPRASRPRWRWSTST